MELVTSMKIFPAHDVGIYPQTFAINFAASALVIIACI